MLATPPSREECNDPEARPYHRRARRSPLRTMPTLADRWTRTLMAGLSHLALLLVWYLFVKFGDVPKFVMPSPVGGSRDRWR